MNFASGDSMPFFSIAIGAFIIFRGVMTLTTGKINPREEAGLQGFSENGIRRYKILSAVTNILGGLVVIAISVVRLLDLVDRRVLGAVVLAILAVMIVAYVLIRNSCKNVE